MPGYKMKDKKKKPMASYGSGGKIFKPCPGCKTKRACGTAKKCMKSVYGK